MSRLRRAMDGLLHRQERCLSARSARLERALPLARLGRHGEHLAQAGQRLAGGLRQSLAHWRQMLVTKLAAVQACDPKRVLQRGFSITRDAKTRAIIRSVSEVRDGRRIVTELADGEFRSTAEDPRQGGLFE